MIEEGSKRDQCVRCGKPVTRRKNDHYCSWECYRPKNVNVCPRCGGSFHAKPSTNRIYCSDACYHKKEEMKARRSEGKVCPTCGKSFSGRNGKYCDATCYENRGSSIPPRDCPICGRTFVTRFKTSKYCSNECKAKSHIVDRVKVRCQQCGKELEVLPHRARRFSHCSLTCQRTAVVDLINLRKWDSGAAPSCYHNSKGWRKMAEKIRNRDGYKCRRCGITQAAYGKTLPVHHKKPIRAGGTDNPRNLITLCRSCHGQVEHEMWRREFARNGHTSKQLMLRLQ